MGRVSGGMSEDDQRGLWVVHLTDRSIIRLHFRHDPRENLGDLLGASVLFGYHASGERCQVAPGHVVTARRLSADEA